MKVVLQNLTKKFPGRGKNKTDEVIAVNDFTFEIPDGKLIGLLGPSGCGKSTCLNLICGLLRPTSGKIYFGEDDVTDLPPESRGVGMVFQNYALYPHLTVKQNIMFPLENLKGDKKMTKQAMEAKALEAAKLVQIDMLMDRKPGELSGGQQQRVAIARALVKTPRVLLLDEPLSNLDARLRLQTREEIRRIQTETGVTTIFVTHDQEEAMSISDMIVVMKDGIVQQIGQPQAVYDDPDNLFVAKFLGTPPINVFEGRVKNGALYAGDDHIPHNKPRYDCLKLGVTWDRETLKRRIDERLQRRLDAGMIDEVRGLIDGGVSVEFLKKLGLEYRFIAQYLTGEITSLEEMTGLLSTAIKQFAKRQMTWFRRDREILWLDMEADPMRQACEAIGKF